MDGAGISVASPRLRLRPAMPATRFFSRRFLCLVTRSISKAAMLEMVGRFWIRLAESVIARPKVLITRG
jgi:hypothetical protein